MTNPVKNPLDLATCLPELPELDWARIAQTPFVFVGTGAVNRPLANQLAWLGMTECTLIDPKRYKPQSAVSQCEPPEVGQCKADVVAVELRQRGIHTTALVLDVDVVPPGYLRPESVVVLAVDNRRAEICANRWAAKMRCPVIKVNVEPAYLTISIRCYDFRQDPLPLCLECQMSDAHYQRQEHPLSCDGGGSDQQATGSPRPLSQLAANAGALAIAQLVGSPERWAGLWWGKQWQQSLLGGQGGFSQLHPNPACRWDHPTAWNNLVRLSEPNETTLRQLMTWAGFPNPEAVQVEVSSRLATRGVCTDCHQQREGIWWVAELDKPMSACDCGGDLMALPFFTHSRRSARNLEPIWDRPLFDWGVTPGAVLCMESPGQRRSFCLNAF